MSRQDTAYNGAEAASNLVDDAENSTADTAKDVQSGARNIGETITRNTAEIAGKVNSRLKEAAMDAEPLVKAAKDRTSDLGTALVDEIKRRPLQAVMVAALAGLVVGVLTSR